MQEVQERNKSCDCAAPQPAPEQFNEACKCDFDADFGADKKTKRGLYGERVTAMNPHAETFPPPPPNNRPPMNNAAAPGGPCNPQPITQCGQQQVVSIRNAFFPHSNFVL